jgi:hypothetical protein
MNFGEECKMETIKDIMEFLNKNEGTISALLTLATITLTYLTVLANWKAVKEMRLTRLDQASPNITVYLERDLTYHVVNLIVENSGNGTAFDIKFKSNPIIDIYPDEEHPLSKSALFNKGIKTLSPHYKNKVLFYWGGRELVDVVYKIDVEYKDVNGRLYTGQFELDIKQFDGELRIIENKEIKQFQEIAKQLRHIYGVHKGIKDEISGIKKELAKK